MKKLTLLLAALSLIVGALFLSACSEPMGSETDDGLADVAGGPIKGYVYKDGEPVAVGLQQGDGIFLSGPSSGTTTSNGDGYFTFGRIPYNYFTTHQIEVISGDDSGSTSFGHWHSTDGVTTWVMIYLD